jgi:hypothetical protein
MKINIEHGAPKFILKKEWQPVRCTMTVEKKR